MRPFLILLSLLLLLPFGSQRATFAQVEQGAASVINDGVPGENSTELRARFLQELALYHPKFVVIYTGMNDAVNERKFTTLESFERNVQWMVDRTMRSQAVPVLVAIQPVDEVRLMQRHAPDAYGSRTPNQRIADHNALLMRLASKRKVAIVRFDEALTAAGGPSAQMSTDGVHLSADGYKLLAAAVWRALQPQWKPGDTVLCMGDSLTFGQGVRPQGAGLRDADGVAYPTYPYYLSQLQIAQTHGH